MKQRKLLLKSNLSLISATSNFRITITPLRNIRLCVQRATRAWPTWPQGLVPGRTVMWVLSPQCVKLPTAWPSHSLAPERVAAGQTGTGFVVTLTVPPPPGEVQGRLGTRVAAWQTLGGPEQWLCPPFHGPGRLSRAGVSPLSERLHRRGRGTPRLVLGWGPRGSWGQQLEVLTPPPGSGRRAGPTSSVTVGQ